MENKAAMLMLSLGLCLLAMAACKTPAASKSLQQAVHNADSIQLHRVDGYPTLSSEQNFGEHYVYGYAVRQRLELTIDQIAELKTALLDSATFDSAVVKSCPMVAQAAIQLWRKGKITQTIVISPAPCGKAIVFSTSKRSKPTYMDLVNGNRLEPAVFQQGK